MNLLVIDGRVVRRYEGRKCIERRELEDGASLEPEWAEFFRVNGMGEPEPEPREPAEVAFERLAAQLENNPPQIPGVEVAS